MIFRVKSGVGNIVEFLEIFRWMKSHGTSLGKLWCDSSVFKNFLGIFLCKKKCSILPCVLPVYPKHFLV
jgi:hypothetical protein